MPKQTHKLAVASLILAYVCWGINTPAIKIAIESMSIPLFLVTRYVIIAIILLPFAIHFWRPMRGKDLFRQATVATIFATGIFLLSFGLTKTSVMHSAILGMLNPIIMLIFAYIFLKDKVRSASLMGVLIALAGACVIVSYRSMANDGSTTSAQLTGDLAILLSVICSVVGIMLLKPLTKKYNPFQTTFVGLSIGIIPMVIYLILNPDLLTFSYVTSQSMFGLSLSALTMASANILFFYALSKRKLSQISFYYYIEPVVTVIIAYLLLSEKLSLLYGIGAVLVGCGIWLAESNKNKSTSLQKTISTALKSLKTSSQITR